MGNLTVKEMASMGGRARAAKLSPEQRSHIAKQAALSRWRKAGTGKYEKQAERDMGNH